MNDFWAPVIRPLLAAVEARHIIEIGAEKGLNTAKIARWCQQNAAVVDVVDPAPSFDPFEFDARFGSAFHFHKATSLDVLSSLLPADVVLIDGDHNWYTVFHEFQAILGADGDPRAAPVVVCHDTSWPYARRDLYYFPETVPEEGRQPMRRGGLVPGRKELASDGLNKDWWHAETEGGPRNGVRTAIEDALAPHGNEFAVRWLEVLFGLAVVAPRSKLEAFPALRALFDQLAVTRTWKALAMMCEWQRAHGVIAVSTVRRLAGEAPPVHAQRPYRSGLSRDQLSAIQSGTTKGVYKGRPMRLNPFDMAIYQALLEELKPGTVFEIGVSAGGRTLWLADGLRNHRPDARVVGVDRDDPGPFDDPSVTFLRGDALQLAESLGSLLESGLPRPFLVIEDAAHDFATTTVVLEFFDAHLRPGDFIVVEDSASAQLVDEGMTSEVSRAIDAFLAKRQGAYEIDARLCDRFGFNMTGSPNGWLRRL